MTTAANPYAILGVLPTSDDVVIRGAYRALMQKYHPDTNASAEATRRASEINEAYATLGDPVRRAAYDRSSRRTSPKVAERRQSSPRPSQPDRRTGGARPQQGGMASIALSAIAAGAGSTKPLMLSLSGAFIALGALGAVSVGTRSPQAAGTPVAARTATGTAQAKGTGAAGTAKTRTVAAVVDDVTNVFDVPSAQEEPAVGNVPAETPATDPMERSRPAPPLDYRIVEAAARDVDKSIRNGGLAVARVESQLCHDDVDRRPSWSAADRCAAYDYAVRLIDTQVAQARGTPQNAYFKFREDGLPDLYRASSLGADLVRVRLQRIRKAATATAYQVLQERLDELTRGGGGEIVAQQQTDATGDLGQPGAETPTPL